jgi:hypothetical protein
VRPVLLKALLQRNRRQKSIRAQQGDTADTKTALPNLSGAKSSNLVILGREGDGVGRNLLVLGGEGGGVGCNCVLSYNAADVS